jgi:hypothetical protein
MHQMTTIHTKRLYVQYTHWPYNIPNWHKNIYNVTYAFQGPRKYSQIGILVWKYLYHLATLHWTVFRRTIKNIFFS